MLNLSFNIKICDTFRAPRFVILSFLVFVIKSFITWTCCNMQYVCDAAMHTNYVSNLRALLITHWPLLSCSKARFPDQSLIGPAYNSFHYKLQQRTPDYSRDNTKTSRITVLFRRCTDYRIRNTLYAHLLFSSAPDTRARWLSVIFSSLDASRSDELKQSDESDVNSRMRHFVRPSYLCQTI